MEKLKKSKERYDNMEVPEELNEVVLSSIEKARWKREEKIRIKKSNRSFLISKWTLAAVALLFAFIIIGVNTSTAFAKELQNIPVLGGFFKVFMVSSYGYEDEDMAVTVEIAGIEDIKNSTNGLADEVNREISNKCNNYVEEAKKRAREYKEAFLETGGTEEEWKEHDIQIKVWYEIKSQSKQYLSFVVQGTENWTSAYAETKYYNLDLTNVKYVLLEDILGKDYIEIANKSIAAQIEGRQRKQGDIFWSAEEGGFKTISDDVKFYLNQKGNPVIVFEKYEIAPGAMGAVEFEIERQE